MNERTLNEAGLWPARFGVEPPLDEDGRPDVLEDPPPIQPGSKLWIEVQERIRRSIEAEREAKRRGERIQGSAGRIREGRRGL